MKILFLGGDLRQIEIIRKLYEEQHCIDVVGYKNIGLIKDISEKKVEDLTPDDYNVIIFPVNGVQKDNSITAQYTDDKIVLPEDILVKTRKDVLIFTGIMTPNLNLMLNKANRKSVVLMNDDEIKKENGIPTVEGIIGNLVYHTKYTINNSNILVFGYGNIGRRLVDNLIHLGAKVTVGVKLESDYKTLKDNHIKVLFTNDRESMEEAIRDNETIINTVPEMILNQDYLRKVKEDSYILDVASYPFGVDFEAATNLGIKTSSWLGIPSDVAPLTAGIMLAKKIKSRIEGGGEK